MELTQNHFLPKLKTKLKSRTNSFKKTFSLNHSKFVSPTAAHPFGISKMTHGLATELFNNSPGVTEQANFNSVANPFKHKKNMQEILIQREKERYVKAAKRGENFL